MKVTVGQIVSTPPTAQALATQVVRDALRIVVARLQAVGLGNRDLKVESLDLTMPAPASQLGTALERSRAARQLAGRIMGQIGPGLGLSSDAAAMVERAQSPQLLHAKTEALVRRAMQAVHYAPQVKVSSAVPAGKVGGKTFGGMGKVKAFFGLGGGKTEIIRPEQTAELVGSNRDFVAFFLEVEARMQAGEGVTPQEWQQLRDGVPKHLSRNGVAFEQSGTEFTMKPEKKGSPLNVLAYSAKKKLGVTMSYNLAERFKPGASVGSFASEQKHLKLDHRSMLYCRPSGTALHELHHGSLYHRIAKDKDTFLNLKMWNMRPRDATLSSAQMYTASMSNQELSTFAKQPRQVVGLHLRDGNTYTEAFDHDLRVYLWKLSQAALQGKEVASKLIPEIQQFLSTGQSSVLKFGQGNDGLEVKFTSAEKGLHHRISIHTHSAEHKKQVGHGKLAAQKALAMDLLQKMELTHDVSELLMLQSHVVMGELRHLNRGQDLLPEEIQILKDLASWPGYGLRVAVDAGKTLAEKKAELARQRALAEGRLGVQPGGVMQLPILEIGGQSGGDDDQHIRMSPMAIAPPGAKLRASTSRAVVRPSTVVKLPRTRVRKDMERVLGYLQLQKPGSPQALRGLRTIREQEITPDNAKLILQVAQRLDPDKRVYALRQKCLHKDPKVLTHAAYTDGALPPDKAAMKNYIKQREHWCPIRDRIHARIIDQEMKKAQDVSNRMLGAAKGVPTILMMRGNSGSGKTYTLSNSTHEAIIGLNVADRTTGADPEGLLNPDDIKYRLTAEFEGGKTNSGQVHSEGSMLTEKLIDTMLQRKQSMVLDKRFGLAAEVQHEVCTVAKNHGYRIVMIDMDAALDTSCTRVAGRKLGGKAPNVKFSAVAHGFNEIRNERMSIKKLCDDGQIDSYFLFSGGTLIAEKLADGSFKIHDETLWKQACTVDNVEVESAKKKWEEYMDTKALGTDPESKGIEKPGAKK